MNRAKDWLAQGKKDIEAAKDVMSKGHYEWACFICQQGAEKALKAVALSLNGELWGHNLTAMLRAISDKMDIVVPEEISSSARQLDKFYIQPRYPNGFDSGAPFEYFDKKDAENAISDAKILVRWCDSLGAGHQNSG